MVKRSAASSITVGRLQDCPLPIQLQARRNEGISERIHFEVYVPRYVWLALVEYATSHGLTKKFWMKLLDFCSPNVSRSHGPGRWLP